MHGAEIRVLVQTGQYIFSAPKTDSLERVLILPTGLQLTQLISNFERIHGIDLRRCIVGSGDGLGTIRWPLLEVAGTDCDRWLRAA